jgi:hypothetical protein
MLRAVETLLRLVSQIAVILALSCCSSRAEAQDASPTKADQ